MAEDSFADHDPARSRFGLARLYPHDLPATDQVEVLRRQARRASEIGYDGVMVSEHHADFPGYLPNPVQLAGLLLDGCPPAGWRPARCCCR